MLQKSLVTFLLYHLYRSLAGFYDAVAWLVSAGKWNRWVKSVVPLVHGRRILEIGHGPGHLLVELIQSGLFVVGLDASPQMGRLAKKRLLRSHQPARLVRGMTQTIPLPDEFFDVIIATFPAPFIVESASIAEISRVLSPDGELIVLLSSRITGTRLLDRMAAFLFTITGQTSSPDENFERFSNPFSNAGFDVQLAWHDQPDSQLLILNGKKTHASIRPKLL